MFRNKSFTLYLNMFVIIHDVFISLLFVQKMHKIINLKILSLLLIYW